MKQIYILASMLFMSISAFSQIPANGLVAAYNFESNWADESGNNLNLCAGGNQPIPPLQLSNNPGQPTGDSAAYFNGLSFLDAYCSSVNGEFSTSSASIAAWFKLDQLQGAYKTIACVRIDNVQSPYNSINLYTGSAVNVKLAMSFSTDGGGAIYDQTIVGTTTLQLGVWYHAACTYDEITGTARLYLNGVEESSITVGAGNLIYVGNALTIGHVQDGSGSNGFNGHIDEVLYYDRALSASEVSQIHGGPVTLPAAPNNLTATSPNPPVINLSWTDNSNNEDGFNIYRGTDPFNLILVDDNAANDATWNDNQSGSLSSGTYYYKACAFNTAGESCSGIAQITINSSVGMNELADLQTANIYPNPANTVLNIVVGESADIQIVDVFDKVISEQKLPSGKSTIAVDGLKAGIYFIQLEKAAVKFVKE